MTTLRYSSLAWAVFSRLFAPRMRLGVRAVRMAGLPRALDPDRPVLLVSNHVSWWDGFIHRELQTALRPGDAFHTVMLEEELARRPFLRLLGGVGITPGRPASFRALLRALSRAREESPALTVLFFPQGRIWPSHRRPLGFHGGVRLVARALSPVTVVPVGLHLEAGHHPAATAYLSLSDSLAVGHGDFDPLLLQERVEGELDRIHDFLAFHGENTDGKWPEAHESLALPSEPLTAGRSS